MTAPPVEPRTWPRRRWWLLLMLVFAGQLAFIFGLSNRTPFIVRPPARAPVLHLAGNASAELMALWDPTLFALPHSQGFSALAWTVGPPAETRAAPAPEPMDYLSLLVGQLGAEFNQFVATNRFGRPPARPEAAPDPGLPTLFLPPALPAPSSVRLEGPLAQRRLIRPLVAPSVAHTEILANSVVQIVVDADGRTISPGVLLERSGSTEADRRALELAQGARFESIRVSGPGRPVNEAGALTWGKLIFEWQTIPVTLSNAPPTITQP